MSSSALATRCSLRDPALPQQRARPDLLPTGGTGGLSVEVRCGGLSGSGSVVAQPGSRASAGEVSMGRENFPPLFPGEITAGTPLTRDCMRHQNIHSPGSHWAL